VNRLDALRRYGERGAGIVVALDDKASPSVLGQWGERAAVSLRLAVGSLAKFTATIPVWAPPGKRAVAPPASSPVTQGTVLADQFGSDQSTKTDTPTQGTVADQFGSDQSTKTDTPTQGTVADQFASDQPIKLGDLDALGLGNIARALSQFLRNRKTQPPLTIAVTGRWGLGKSSLMWRLKEELEGQDFRPVWFNAWHHQKEESLLGALLEHIRRDSVPGWHTPAGLIFRAKLFRARFVKEPLRVVVALVLLAAAAGIFYSLDEAAVKKIAALLEDGKGSDKTIAMIKTLASYSAPVLALIPLLGTVQHRLKDIVKQTVSGVSYLRKWFLIKDFNAQIALRYRFAQEFDIVTRSLRPLTLVIFIDDLDRCQPSVVMDMLETVNFLVSSGECYVVLGIDAEWVKKSVALSYRDIADAEVAAAPQVVNESAAAGGRQRQAQQQFDFAGRYLQKLINIEVPVPEAKPAQSVIFAGEIETKDSSQTAELAAARERLGLDREAVVEQRRRQRQKLAGPFAVCLIAIIGAGFAGSQLGKWLPSPSADRNVSAFGSVLLASTSTGTAASPPQAAPASVAHAVATSASDRGWLAYGLLPALLALLLLGAVVAVRREMRRQETEVATRDSKPFEQALADWMLPVFLHDRTPRSVKRFINRVRYFAIRQQGLKRHINEVDLVAMAALHHIHPELPSLLWESTIANDEKQLDEELKRKRVSSDRAAEVVAAIKRWARTSEAQHNKDDLTGREALDAFDAWSAGITVR
jgi:hypothetical protein